MTINGIYYTEPEVQAYISKLKTELGSAEDYIDSRNERIAELEAVIKRYQEENFRLTEQINDIGNEYNMQVSTIGWLEEKNAELEELINGWKEAYNDLRIGYKKGHCAICKHGESTGLIGKCKECFNFSLWVWRYAEKYRIDMEVKE